MIDNRILKPNDIQVFSDYGVIMNHLIEKYVHKHNIVGSQYQQIDELISRNKTRYLIYFRSNIFTRGRNAGITIFFDAFTYFGLLPYHIATPKVNKSMQMYVFDLKTRAVVYTKTIYRTYPGRNNFQRNASKTLMRSFKAYMKRK